MGAAESKGHITPPDTPVYLKYSHLKELSDPRSPMPCGGQRTPILKPEETWQLDDPRSPSYAIPRTPVYCIQEPEEDKMTSEDKDVELNSNKLAVETGDYSKLDEVGSDEPTLKEIEQVEKQPESSPEKVSNLTEFSDKGYLITKNKSTVVETKKRRRRKRGKQKMNNENKDHIKSEKASNFDSKVPRSPLISRNNVSLYRNQSPSLDCLIKKTNGLSFKSKPRPISFPDLDAFGKENLAATFSP